jgi:hypothetical protein
VNRFLSKPEQVVSWLLRHHYQRRQLPPSLVAFAVRSMKRHPGLAKWNLESLLSDRAAFFAFLQEQWSRFLDEQMRPPGAKEPGAAYDGAANLVPFQNENVRLYLDNCFSEGLLQPVEHPAGNTIALRSGMGWVAAGLQRQQTVAEINGWLKRAVQAVPAETASYQAWQIFASVWAGARAGVARLAREDEDQGQSMG